MNSLVCVDDGPFAVALKPRGSAGGTRAGRGGSAVGLDGRWAPAPPGRSTSRIVKASSPSRIAAAVRLDDGRIGHLGFARTGRGDAAPQPAVCYIRISNIVREQHGY